MIKRSLILTISLAITIIVADPALSQEKRIISLKDGTSIVGEIVSFENNIYTVSSSLGQLKINDQDIVSISTAGLGTTPLPVIQPKSSSSALDGQIMQVQQQLMADPSFIEGAKSISEDPEVMAILKQPEVAQAIMNHDINALQSNPQFRNLLSNPKILELMQSAGQKLGSTNSDP